MGGGGGGFGVGGGGAGAGARGGTCGALGLSKGLGFRVQGVLGSSAFSLRGSPRQIDIVTAMQQWAQDPVEGLLEVGHATAFSLEADSVDPRKPQSEHHAPA